MFITYLALFVIVPFVELYILIELGKSIGVLPTLGIVVITGIAGAALAKQQGLGVWHRIQTELSYGHMPGDVLFDGVLVLIGSVLLLTPGILTDITGFILLIPPGRFMVKKYVKAWASKKIQSGQMTYYTHTGFDEY
ncbi:MAG: membrane protein FxsA [Methanosarcinales archaeon]|nr:membrane protein FxsA [Methanosarcinales archaeon]